MRSPTDRTNSGCNRLSLSTAAVNTPGRRPPVRSVTIANWNESERLLRFRWVQGFLDSTATATVGAAGVVAEGAPVADKANATPRIRPTTDQRKTGFTAALRERDGPNGTHGPNGKTRAIIQKGRQAQCPPGGTLTVFPSFDNGSWNLDVPRCPVVSRVVRDGWLRDKIDCIEERQTSSRSRVEIRGGTPRRISNRPQKSFDFSSTRRRHEPCLCGLSSTVWCGIARESRA